MSTGHTIRLHRVFRAPAERVYREYVETPTLRRTDLLDALHLRWVRARIAGRERSWSPALP